VYFYNQTFNGLSTFNKGSSFSYYENEDPGSLFSYYENEDPRSSFSNYENEDPTLTERTAYFPTRIFQQTSLLHSYNLF